MSSFFMVDIHVHGGDAFQDGETKGDVIIYTPDQ
jgi:hypothetical protein